MKGCFPRRGAALFVWGAARTEKALPAGRKASLRADWGVFEKGKNDKKQG